MPTRKSKNQINATMNQGIGGGILGAFVGAPGLGVAIGIIHANKDKIKKNIKKFDNSF